MPSKNSRNKKLKSRLGTVATCRKPNKQGKSQSTAHPQHHPIPKLLHTHSSPAIKVGKVVLSTHVVIPLH